MDRRRDGDSAMDDLRVGNHGLLYVAGRHFLVRIVEVTPTTVRTTFPGRDYPSPGMTVDLEFHDETGFSTYQTRVIHSPAELGDGVELDRPKTIRRDVHRHSVRVPAGVAVQIKEQIHIKRHTADLVNLSAGGALIRTETPFEMGAAVEMTLAFPGGATHTLLGRIVHAAVSEVGSRTASADASGEAGSLYGIQFVGVEPEANRSIAQFIWERLREDTGENPV